MNSKKDINKIKHAHTHKHSIPTIIINFYQKESSENKLCKPKNSAEFEVSVFRNSMRHQMLCTSSRFM